MASEGVEINLRDEDDNKANDEKKKVKDNVDPDTNGTEMSTINIHDNKVGKDYIPRDEKADNAVQAANGFDAFRPLDIVITYATDTGKDIYKKHQMPVLVLITALCVAGYTAYFIIALSKNFDRALDLFIVTMFALYCVVYWLIRKFFGEPIYNNIFKPFKDFIQSRWLIFKWVSIAIVIILIVLWLVLDTASQPIRLISLAGLAVYVLMAYTFSNNRRQVRWRPVLWGLTLQFLFGVLILRTRPGFLVFDWLGDRATIFLSFSDAGAKFLFGAETYTHHFFAFKVLPVVVFFSAFIYMVYYLGVMQIVIKKIAWLMQVTMGTSAAESLNAAGNIFIGQTEAPLLIRPFLDDMTLSELHAVMTGGFATIAGSVLGAYIAFGVSASHLLSASVMSAPAALAISKLMYPEEEVPKTLKVEDIVIEKGKERNAIEALAAGASMSISLVANIAVMLIAFLSVLELLNAVLTWLGGMVDIDGLTFQLICSYVLMPFSYVMGVDWDDCFIVAELLGIKTFLNEFVAYEKLSEYIQNRVQRRGGETISQRSEIIATYALCGFANIGSVAVQIGGISALVPHRRSDLAKIAMRALVAGTIACFMTACIAGILYDESLDDSKVNIPQAVAKCFVIPKGCNITYV